MAASLSSTRRRVNPERLDDYTRAWHQLRETVEARGGRAWLFRSARSPDEFMEFIEFRGADSLLDDRAVAGALRFLDRTVGPGSTETWEEA
jgi:hypothetical protein